MPVIANLMIWKANGKVILFTERGWSQILSTVQIGENYTSSLIFDSLRFSGIRLFRDMQMLPDSMQSFTPLVQGVAQSNALITVSQNGYIIYQKRFPGTIYYRRFATLGQRLWSRCQHKGSRWQCSFLLVPYSSVPNMLQLVFQISILSPDAVRYMV